MTRRAFLGGSAGILTLAACGSTNSDTDAAVLNISAIPDQDQEKLSRLYGAVADRFAAATGLEVRYRTVTDYTAVVRAFEVGDVQVAWMGGLTGVQARNRVEGATAIAQRDIDADFHSVFIATRSSGLRPFDDIAGLRQLAGHTFTFGSETSTSGRLMPQYFMDKGGLAVSELRGKPGFLRLARRHNRSRCFAQLRCRRGQRAGMGSRGRGRQTQRRRCRCAVAHARIRRLPLVGPARSGFGGGARDDAGDYRFATRP